MLERVIAHAACVPVNQTARKPCRPFVCPALWQGFIDGQGFIDVEALVLSNTMLR